MKHLFFAILLSILFIGILPSQAQAIGVTAFSGTQPMVVRYVEDRALQIASVTEAVNAASPIYQAIFTGGPSFKLFVDIVNATDESNYALTQVETIEIPATTDGAVGFSGMQEVCRIRLFRAPEFDNNLQARHNVAHELAHCYQKFNVNEAALNDAASISWWFEGSAEWMASLVYSPEDSIIVNDTRNAFTAVLPSYAPLFELDYTAQYFWSYLRYNTDLVSIGNLLKNMPTRSNQLLYLKSEIANFPLSYHRYAVELAQGLLPAQPSADSLFRVNTRSIDFGAVERQDIDLALPSLGVNFLEINFSGLVAGEGLKLVFTQGTDETFLSLSNGLNISNFGADGYIHCSFAPLRLVQSSTGGIDLGTGVSILRVEKVPCIEEPPAGVDECLVGHWQLDISDGFGPQGMPKSPVMWGGYTIDIYADGLYVAQMSIRVLERNTQQAITMQFFVYARMTSLQNNSSPAGRALYVSDMTIRSDIINQTIPFSTAAGVSALRLNCTGNIMTLSDPVSGVSFRFTRR